MYSYEERIRAVKLYLKLGKRLTATVRQLGYPTTKSLERWHHTYERCRALPKERICLRPRYSAEQKKGGRRPLYEPWAVYCGNDKGLAVSGTRDARRLARRTAS